MAPKILLRRALDYNARKVTSKMRVPFGTHLYDRGWLSAENLDITKTTFPVRTPGIRGRGLRLVQISDLHLGLYVGNRQLLWLRKRIQNLDPDLVVITGDFVNRSASEAYPAREGLAAVASVAPTWGVLGNHDFWEGAEDLASFLEDCGVRMLRNEHETVEIEGNRFLLAGVDDWKTGHDDLARAAAGMPDEPLFRLLLSHCPDLLHPASDYGFDLVLSGHTHGSQIRVPWMGPAINRFMHGEFERGWMRAKETALYINRGLGAVFVPVRYRSRAEVTLLHLAPVGTSIAARGFEAARNEALVELAS